MSETDYFYENDGRYCYPCTDVLMNKPGITDKERLERLETTVTVILDGDDISLVALIEIEDQSCLCRLPPFLSAM